MIAWKEKHHGEGPVLIQKDKLKGKWSKQLLPYYRVTPKMENVDRDNCWWNLWFSREQKVSITERAERIQKEVQGHWDQLYIDKMLLQEVKQRKKNLVMGQFDFWKACGMVAFPGW